MSGEAEPKNPSRLRDLILESCRDFGVEPISGDGLLAHYTSLAALEQIVRSNQFHFSNLLYMNDTEELVSGLARGRDLVRASEKLRESLGDAGAKSCYEAFDDFLDEYSPQHVINTYAACFSIHDATDQDGSLAMWRGYGANGNGVAIVLRAAALESTDATSPFWMSRIGYWSAKEWAERAERFLDRFSVWLQEAQLLDPRAAAQTLFEWVRCIALFTKHSGFREEREGRIVYLSQRDADGAFASDFSYRLSGDVVKPVLKYGFGVSRKGERAPVTLETALDRIILGPGLNTPHSLAAIREMLRRLNRPELVSRVLRSEIPYRP